MARCRRQLSIHCGHSLTRTGASIIYRCMTEQSSTPPAALDKAERSVATVGVAAGFAALFSAAACCVLPIALAFAGIGAGGFVFIVPYHWPLTIAAGVAVAVGWTLYIRKRQLCISDATCAVQAPSRTTFLLLSAATAFVLLAVAWKELFEAPLQAWLLNL